MYLGAIVIAFILLEGIYVDEQVVSESNNVKGKHCNKAGVATRSGPFLATINSLSRSLPYYNLAGNVAEVPLDCPVRSPLHYEPAE